MSETRDATDTIDLSVPLRAEYGSTIRVVVSSVAADLGFSVDEIEDLRLGVSEVFNLLTEEAGDRPDTCHVTLTMEGDAVSMTISNGRHDVVHLDPLAATILSSVVDEHRVTEGGLVLRKRGLEARTEPD